MRTINLKAILLLLLCLSVILSSCGEDENGPGETKIRYIYFPVSIDDGASENEQGLYKFSTENTVPDRIVTQSVVYTTGIGANGVLVFEYSDAVEKKLWGIWEDGSSIEAPFPAPDEGWEYDYHIPPRINLSPDGHHVAYFIDHKPLEAVGPTDIMPEMILFNCSNQVMNTVQLYDFIINTFSEIEANAGEPFGEYMLLNKDGSRVYFVLKGMKYDSDVIVDERYCIIEWANNILTALSELTEDPIELCGLDYLTRKIIIKRSGTVDTIKTFSPDGEFAYTALKPENLSNPNQFVVSKSEMVIWTDYGLEIVFPDGGGLYQRVISYDEIDPDGKYIHRGSKRLSISQDGEIIVFALPKNVSPQLYTMFMVDRNGENFKILVEDLAMGAPVVSGEFDSPD